MSSLDINEVVRQSELLELTDRSSRHYDVVRSSILFLVLFIALYALAFFYLRHVQSRAKSSRPYNADLEELEEERGGLTFLLGCYVLAVALLWPSVVVLALMIPLSGSTWLLSWLTPYLARLCWQGALWLSSITVFAVAPFAYLFYEAEGFTMDALATSLHINRSGSQGAGGHASRVLETIAVLALTTLCFVGTITLLFNITGTRRPSFLGTQTEGIFWLFSLPTQGLSLGFMMCLGLGLLFFPWLLLHGLERMLGLAWTLWIPPNYAASLQQERDLYSIRLTSLSVEQSKFLRGQKPGDQEQHARMMQHIKDRERYLLNAHQCVDRELNSPCFMLNRGFRNVMSVAASALTSVLMLYILYRAARHAFRSLVCLSRIGSGQHCVDLAPDNECTCPKWVWGAWASPKDATPLLDVVILLFCGSVCLWAMFDTHMMRRLSPFYPQVSNREKREVSINPRSEGSRDYVFLAQSQSEVLCEQRTGLNGKMRHRVSTQYAPSPGALSEKWSSASSGLLSGSTLTQLLVLNALCALLLLSSLPLALWCLDIVNIDLPLYMTQLEWFVGTAPGIFLVKSYTFIFWLFLAYFALQWAAVAMCHLWGGSKTGSQLVQRRQQFHEHIMSSLSYYLWSLLAWGAHIVSRLFFWLFKWGLSVLLVVAWTLLQKLWHFITSKMKA